MAAGSFSAGLSGLSANATYLSVIGNNLANINTVGFKSSTVTFADLVSQTLGGGSSVNPMQIGLGAATGSISPIFSQGPIDNSPEATNVALQGQGFFIVQDRNGATSYTRAGAFSFDPDGRLVAPDGRAVQGYTQINPNTGAIITTGQLADIVVPPGVLRAPAATTTFGTLSNLDANVPIDAVNPEFTTSVQVYDSLGAPHVLSIDFNRTGAGAWTYTVTVPNLDVNGVAGAAVTLGTGNLTFDGTGQLTAPAADVTITAPAQWANGATPNDFTWNLYDPNGVPMLTSFSAASQTSSIVQNGEAAGQIQNLSISPDGAIIGTFGAGKSITLAVLAVASFNNPKGLLKLGTNLYGESQAAGLPSVGTPGTGGRGTVIGSALEQSNVDIAREFTQMILAQRGYQANARSITTSDEVLLETLQLKR